MRTRYSPLTMNNPTAECYRHPLNLRFAPVLLNERI
jgi:hypothetical protein